MKCASLSRPYLYVTSQQGNWKKKGGQTVEEKSGIIRICPQLKNKKKSHKTKQNKTKKKRKWQVDGGWPIPRRPNLHFFEIEHFRIDKNKQQKKCLTTDENNNIMRRGLCSLFLNIFFFKWNKKECVFLPLIHHAGFFQYGGSLAGSLYHYARWITHKHSECV